MTKKRYRKPRLTLADIEVDQDKTYTAADILVLKSEIKKLTEECTTLKYHAEGLSDFARMNLAGAILPALLADHSEDFALENSIRIADLLVSRYQEIMENKANQYRAMFELHFTGDKESASGEAEPPELGQEN